MPESDVEADSFVTPFESRPDTFSAPVPDPMTVGRKVTCAVQDCCGSSVEGQLLVWVKSPLAEIVLMVMGPSPELKIVTDWALLAKPTTVSGKSIAVGETPRFACIPVPLRGTLAKVVTGSMPVMYLIETLPSKVPVEFGEKLA